MKILLLCLSMGAFLLPGVWSSSPGNSESREPVEDGAKLHSQLEETVQRVVGDDLSKIVTEFRRELSMQDRRIRNLEQRDRRTKVYVSRLETRLKELESKLNSHHSSMIFSDQHTAEPESNIRTHELKDSSRSDHQSNGRLGARNGIFKVAGREINTEPFAPKRQAAPIVTHIAFSAYLDHAVKSMGVGHTIKMNQVLLNDGNGYHAAMGVFMAPVSGVYMFTYHFIGYPSPTNLRLVLDGRKEVEAVAQSANIFETGSNSVILRVAAGQGVWLEEAEGNGGTVYSTPTQRYCTFSGALLY